nr:MAG TPA: hypothetical protein [Caudoviricetes sp.]
MTKFMRLKEMAHAIQVRFGGAPVIDVVGGGVVFRDSVVTLQVDAKSQAGCVWVVDTPGDYRAFRRSDEVLDVLAAVYSYSLV